ncbi:MAG: universal stress protein [Kofleriaceae bacterium]
MAIICGTDLSDASHQALAVAQAMAKLDQSEVVVVHVVGEEEQVDAARAGLDAFVAGTNLRAELVVGETHETLTQFAEAEGSELVVIAAGGRSTLGSTAAKIIEITRTPLLVIRDAAPWLAFAAKQRPLKLLAAVDDSIASELGLQWTHALRTRGPVDVVLGAIYYPDDAAEHYGVHAKTLVDRDPEIEKLLSRDLLRRFGATDGVIARTRRGLGRIGDHVIELANEEKVDAIIIGTSQKTGLGKLGSVSSIVVEEAPQSVVCVPPNAQLATIRVPVMTSALVATDLSPFANRAVAYAFATIPEGGEIHIAHVVEDKDEVDEADLLRQLNALPPKDISGRKVTAHVLRGHHDAAGTIAQAGARLGVDVILSRVARSLGNHASVDGLGRGQVVARDEEARARASPGLISRPARSSGSGSAPRYSSRSHRTRGSASARSSACGPCARHPTPCRRSRT